eukprot:g698.t1
MEGVKTALRTLREFYKSSGVQVTSGERKGAAGGVIGRLEEVEADMAMSLTQMRSAEKTAASNFDKDMQDMKLEKVQKEKDISFKTSEAMRLDGELAELSNDQESHQTEMSALQDFIKGLEAECLVTPESFAEKQAKKQQEIDGLKDALEALQETPAALIQRRSRALRGQKSLTTEYLFRFDFVQVSDQADLIKLRPLMEVPQVVHRSKRSEARPTTGSSICHDLSRLSTPSTPRGKAPFFGAEIYAKTGCNSHSPRKPWRVTCPKDCTCGARTARGKSKDDALPKLWMQWQAKTIASHEFPSMSEDTVEDTPVRRVHRKIFPVRRAKTLACGEKSLALKDERCADEFRTVDSDRDGKLSMQQFEILVRKRCDMTPGEQMPSTLASTMQKAADQRGDGKVAFEDFLLWVWQCIFMEEILGWNGLEKRQRNQRRGVFHSSIAAGYWSEASNTSSEQIGFPDFVRWYAKNFA